MVRALIHWSLHNRFIVLLATIALIAVGVYSANNLNVEAYPDPTPPLVEVITQNHGMSPEEMEKLIGIPARDRAQRHAGPEIPAQHLAGGVERHQMPV